MKTHTTHLQAPLLLLFTLCFLASPAYAMEEIIGTWRRSDNSLVEFRPDGSVVADTGSVGRWEKLRDSAKYVLRFTGARDFYYVTLGGYQRKLSMKLNSNGTGPTIDRVDDGPTTNPDVPDERAAMELEFTDLENGIESSYARLAQVQAEAAEYRLKHEIARSLGKISGWIPLAQKKEAEAKGIEAGINGQKRRLAELETKLGKKARVSAPVPVNTQPVQPGYPPGMVPPGYPPGVFPPGYVPGMRINPNMRR